MNLNPETAPHDYFEVDSPGYRYAISAAGSFGTGAEGPTKVRVQQWSDAIDDYEAILGELSDENRQIFIQPTTRSIILTLIDSEEFTTNVFLEFLRLPLSTSPNNSNVVSAIATNPAAVRDAAQVTGKINMVFLGDSFTAAIAQGNDRETYPYYLQRMIPYWGNFYNLGVSGRRAENMLAAFSEEVAPYLTQSTGLPSILFVLGGINDGEDRTPAQILGYLQGIWAAARAAGAMVVAMTLPDRDAAGGLSEADWKTLNALIVAASADYDLLVRLDIIFNNAQSADYLNQPTIDFLHINTAAHRKLAGQVLGVLHGRDVYPSLPTDVTCSSCTTAALAANTTRRLPFLEAYDVNADATTDTISGDTLVRVVTVPVDGRYEVSSSIIFGTLTAGDIAYISAYIVPVTTGTPVEHRLGESFDQASGPNMGSGGTKRFDLKRGDKIYIGAITTRAGATILNNPNFSTFQVRLVSLL